MGVADDDHVADADADARTPTTPTLSWPSPAGIVYGTALTSAQLDATASVPGTFSYSPPLGTVLGAGTDTLSVTFTPTDTTDYTTATTTTTIAVAQATPGVVWNNPASIVYGTALSSAQLDATASVPGTFTYTPAAGTVLGVGDQPGPVGHLHPHRLHRLQEHHDRDDHQRPARDAGGHGART